MNVVRMPGTPPLLELIRVSRQYPGVLALDDVSFTLERGEVHVLFGENGAGKSTLISIISGANQPTSGSVLMDGEPVHFASVHDARCRGITTVFQELSLVPSMTVEENMCLGNEATHLGILDKKAIRRQVSDVLDQLDFALAPTALVSHLSRAEQQMVEIARAFMGQLSVLILDEPTASLTDREAERVFELVEAAKARGVGIIYITHRLREIERLADRITVLRDGRHIETIFADGLDEDALIERMTGRQMGAIYPTVKERPGREVLALRALTTASGSVKNASLTVRSGEIVGIAGLAGSGKSEVIRAAFGLEAVASGCVELGGKDITGQTPKQMLDEGFLYLPPDRRVEGLALNRSCTENMSLAAIASPPFAAGPFINRRAESRETVKLAARMELYPMRPDFDVSAFSGGNQQKVLLSRCLTRPFILYAFDEPTVGVDVGTRAAIYRFIRDLCEAGAAVILISSDLPEILNLAHRAYVFAGGRIQAELPKSDLSESTVLKHFFERKLAG